MLFYDALSNRHAFWNGMLAKREDISNTTRCSLEDQES
jgi:hypothetical protein